MKNLILVLALIFGGMTVSAQVAPETLGAAMKVMSGKLKAISAQVSNPAMNDQSAALADDFVTATLSSKQFTPDTITDLPADQQAGRKALYDHMLDQAADLGQQLAAAFRAGDNAKAADLLTQLSQAKKDGHSEFKN